jgi:hypothetical protein
MSKNASHSRTAKARGVACPRGLPERQSSLGAHACVQREAIGPGVQPSAPSLVREVLNSPGQALDTGTRAFMEPRFGFDFSSVRVHNDEAAAKAARAVSANAYTSGNHIAFGDEKYAPTTRNGQSLLAHELTHVIQQASGPVSGTASSSGLHVSHPEDPHERSARAAADSVLLNRLDPIGGLKSLSAIPPPTTAPGGEYLQRDGLFGSATASSDVGAVAGIVGAGLGAAALGLALFAYLRPPEALNPAPVTGGISLNPNPFSFNTMQQTPSMPQVTPVHEPKSNQAHFKEAQKGPPKVQKVLDLRTDDKNHAELNIALRTDGYNIVDASMRTGAMEKYWGGSRGSSATINFSATQTGPAPGIFDAPEPKASPKEQSESSQGGQPQSGAPAPGQTNAKEGQEQSQSNDVAEVMVSFTGTNTKNQDPPQTFAGSFTVNGKGDIDVSQPEVTNGIGRADKAANVAEIDYRGPVGGGSTSGGSEMIQSPSEPSRGLGLPRFDVPNPPILDRPGGIPE